MTSFYDTSRDEQLSGVGGSLRYRALVIDNLLTIVAGVAFWEIFSPMSDVVGGIAAVLAYGAYFFLQEGLMARTLGKRMNGLIVVKLDGSRPGWTEAGGRTLLRLIEVNPFIGAIPGWIVMLCSQRKQRLGDMIAGTVVVPVDRVAFQEVDAR
jgi:uncharacterized RDD family membrane protein YckC